MGEAALRAVLQQSPCDATVVMVDSARHAAFKVAKAKSDTVRRANIATIKAHVFEREFERVRQFEKKKEWTECGAAGEARRGRCVRGVRGHVAS